MNIVNQTLALQAALGIGSLADKPMRKLRIGDRHVAKGAATKARRRRQISKASRGRNRR